MHLFKEAFGETYSYYPNDNLETVRDVLGRKTEYQYNGTNDLTVILEPNGVKTANSYDHHNLKNP